MTPKSIDLKLTDHQLKKLWKFYRTHRTADPGCALLGQPALDLAPCKQKNGTLRVVVVHTKLIPVFREAIKLL